MIMSNWRGALGVGSGRIMGAVELAAKRDEPHFQQYLIVQLRVKATMYTLCLSHSRR